MEKDIIDRQKDIINSFWEFYTQYSSEIKRAKTEHETELLNAEEIKQTKLSEIENTYQNDINNIENNNSKIQSQFADHEKTLNKLLFKANQELNYAGLDSISIRSVTLPLTTSDNLKSVLENHLPSSIDSANKSTQVLINELVKYAKFKYAIKITITLLSVAIIGIAGIVIFNHSINNTTYDRSSNQKTATEQKHITSPPNHGDNTTHKSDVANNNHESTLNKVQNTSNDDGVSYINKMLQYAIDNGGITNHSTIINTAYELNNKYPCPTRKHIKGAREANERGISLIKENLNDQALEEFKSAYNIDSTDNEILSNLGYAYLQVGDFKNAEIFLLKSLVYDPGRPTSWGSLGQLYAKQGSIPFSVAAFSNAFRFTRNTDKTRIYLNNIIEHTNDNNLKQAAEQALQLPYIEPIQPKFCSK